MAASAQSAVESNTRLAAVRNWHHEERERDPESGTPDVNTAYVRKLD